MCLFAIRDIDVQFAGRSSITDGRFPWLKRGEDEGEKFPGSLDFPANDDFGANTLPVNSSAPVRRRVNRAISPMRPPTR